jgi:hypothetical protein
VRMLPWTYRVSGAGGCARAAVAARKIISAAEIFTLGV